MSLCLYTTLALSRHEPRFHGNGFVQLPLEDDARLHVWHPSLPQIDGHNAEIHDHVWDMESKVLHGSLDHTTYDLAEANLLEPRYDVYSVGVSNSPGMGPMVDANLRLVQTGRYRLAAGSSYYFPQNQLHTSHAGSSMVVTLMTKLGGSTTLRPRVVCPAGEQPVDAFAKEHQPRARDMWIVIRRALDMLQPWALDEVKRVAA